MAKACRTNCDLLGIRQFALDQKIGTNNWGKTFYVRGYGRTKMKKLVLSIALSALVSVAICGTTQAAYYHHRHHHYWHHGGHPIAGYWNYYRTDWPGRGNNEASTR
jgi:hypothetical protein